MKKIFIITFFLAFISRPCHATIIDMPEIILQIVNNVNDALVYIDERYQEYQKVRHEIKTGIMNSATVNLIKDVQSIYNTVNNAIDAVKRAQKISVLDTFYTTLSQAEILSYAELEFNVRETLVPTLGDGEDSVNLSKLRELADENLKNSIATLYARALSTRLQTHEESKEEEPNITFSSEAELLETIRPIIKKTVIRKSNVLFMESAVLEYYGLKELKGAKAIYIEADQTPEEIVSTDQKEEQKEKNDENKE